MRCPLTRAEYDRLVSLGFLAGERVELLHGVIVPMSPQGTRHVYAIGRLAELLLPALLGRAQVRIRMPFAASDDSEPEPDVAVVPLGDWLDDEGTLSPSLFPDLVVTVAQILPPR